VRCGGRLRTLFVGAEEGKPMCLRSALWPERSGAIARVLTCGWSEHEADIDGALADCATQDQACRVIAVGPFAVEPK